MGTLAGGVGHDIGNLLVPLQISIENLKPVCASGETSRDLSVIAQITEYLRSLVRGLRHFARDSAEGGKAATDLAQWTKDVAPLLKGSLPRGFRLEVDIDSRCGEGCQIAIAPHRLTQAILNLVQNSKDAVLDAQKAPLTGSEGVDRGVIELFVRPSTSGDRTGMVQVGVRDNGAGMTAEVKRRCVEPFFTTKGTERGTGMGMAMIRNIVSDASGSLEIESEPGVGTTVSLHLRVASGEPANP